MEGVHVQKMENDQKDRYTGMKLLQCAGLFYALCTLVHCVL